MPPNPAPQATAPTPPAAPQQAPGQPQGQLASMLAGLEGIGDALGAPGQHHQARLVEGRLGIASSLFTALRCKHPATAAHSLRVALSASAWAASLNMPDQLRTRLEMAALLHDIGKIGVPDSVLLKPGRLQPAEAELMSLAPTLASDILRSAGAPKQVIELIRASAAWFNGTHREVKLAGDQIPVAARMLSIVDAFDSMTTDHVYRPARSRERALGELVECSGTQFDPALVRSFSEHVLSDQRRLMQGVAERWLGGLNPTGGSPTTLPWQATAGEAPGVTPAGAAAGRDALFEKKLIENLHDGVVFVDAQRRITMWSTGAERLTGVASGAAVGQVLAPTLLEMCEPSGRLLDDCECPVAHAIQAGVQSITRLGVLGRQGSHVDIDLQAIPVQGETGAVCGATVVMHDASSESTLEQRCQALHAEMTKDPLTQVANRAEFDRMLAMFVDAHQETQLPCALIMTDIDHFKRINDTYGHQAGDDAIISFAALLKSMCRTGDLVARYGGEEFAVLCADCNNATAAARAEQMRRKLSETPQPRLGDKCITASFGVTELQPGDTPETLLRRSDRALLEAKDQGRNQVVQLGAGMPDEAPKKSWWPFLATAWGGRKLIETKLVTNVPMAITIQKLRGFIADHNAQVVRAADNELRIQSTDGGVSNRRDKDRPLGFVIDLKLAEEQVERELGGGAGKGAYSQTVIEVSLRPRRDRDRRGGDAAHRARLMLGSLKSYLMAKEVSADGNPTG